MNYIVKHWRGEYSLPLSFWFNYSIVANIAAALADKVDFGATLWAGLPIGIWGFVGAWRAATKRGGGWGVTTCVVLSLQLLLALAALSILWQKR